MPRIYTTNRVTLTCESCGKTFARKPSEVMQHTYCSVACYRALSLADRFWGKVDRSGDCWLWLAGTDDDGYGKFTRDNVTVRAHRMAYILAHGEIDDTILVCHTCDNPPCVRPIHLFLGTNLDNVADRVRKGRGLYGDRNPSRIYPERQVRGNTHPLARLTADAIPQIRAMRATGQTYAEIAPHFGVHCDTIRDVILGRTWQHVV